MSVRFSFVVIFKGHMASVFQHHQACWIQWIKKKRRHRNRVATRPGLCIESVKVKEKPVSFFRQPIELVNDPALGHIRSQARR